MVDDASKKDTSVRPSDALGALRARSQASRTVMVLIAVAGVIIATFVLGLIWRTVTGGIRNAPSIPAVNV